MPGAVSGHVKNFWLQSSLKLGVLGIHGMLIHLDEELNIEITFELLEICKGP